MNKSLTLLLVFLTVAVTQAQEKLITRTGVITFSSETSMENIEATSSQAASIFDTSKNVIAFNVLLKSFKFEKALMEEHFNEKYVHSDKHPAAKFKGTIDQDIDLNTAQVYNDVTISGSMILHGVTSPKTVKAVIEVMEDKSVKVTSDFKITLATYKVEIPSLVKDKISADIDVNLEANYK